MTSDNNYFSSDGNYEKAKSWLKSQADEIGLEFNIVEFERPAEFAIWMTWKGSRPELKSILLNSHIDVVPVDQDKWTWDPFAAEMDSNGNIFARGTQDMKSVGIQYLEAIRTLKVQGFVPERSVHVSFVPDEELGGTKGMKVFVETPEFLKLNVGFGLDEGIGNPDESFVVSYGERAIWQVKFTAKGNTGHALRFIEDTAAEKLQTVINKMLDLRCKEKKRLESDSNLGMGSVTSVNMTILQGGLQINIVPPELSASFDLRVTPKWDISDALKFLDGVCTEAGPGVSYEWIFRSDHGFAQTELQGNSFWEAFEKACNEMELKLDVQVFPGATDIRYLRHIGIPALGFSPINNTPVLLHDNDEFLNDKVFLRGITIYERIIRNVTSAADVPTIP
ncbi:unnamed protein product [Allacma fusca]|uniref:N-acyl-aliphatic-L-amino acid amidohydrolase n=1 Tax=Allacma fusca TaxID=39272 RepID=A0A8J2PG37_9HEXA|nr:unnamed protein product [Allacma fusca]